MKRMKILAGYILAFMLVGCAPPELIKMGPQSIVEPREDLPQLNVETVKAESDLLAANYKQLRESLEQTQPEPIEIEPLMPTYDPLDDRTVSFSMVNEDLQMVLYALSQSVGMNLIIDPNVNMADRRVTINFKNVPAGTVLKEVLGTFDLNYEIIKNVIRVVPYLERMFSLNFLDTTTDTDFVIGGDVLSAGEETSMSSLSGSFKMTGKGSTQGKSNSYDVIEILLKGVLSDGGKYTLNRLSGTLFVRDTPDNIRAVARLINDAKEMLSRQILIEARIIEVALEEKYEYGIDWDVLKENVATGGGFWNLTYAIENGLGLTGISGNFTYGATIDALNTFGDVKVVSNPVIRTKHGKSAMISVGTSISYTKSTDTTTIGAGATATTTTAVEVSKVFDGLILGVIPFIEKSGKITLMINPIQSEVDPDSLELVNIGSNVSISLPQVGIMEMSSILALQNGDTIILGGLIDHRKVMKKEGVPILSAIPLFGYLFKDEMESDVKKELVIILSVNIV